MKEVGTIWKTSELITPEKYAPILARYHGNWEKNNGLMRYAKRIHSRNEDDGLIEGIFQEIGSGSKYYVEFGAGDGCQMSMTRHLREEHAWQGLLLDAEYENTSLHLHREFITAENIVPLFEKYGVPKDLDFLSIDIDGNDYWVWKALSTHYRPRLLVVETNQFFSPEDEKTIVYNPDHHWEFGSRYFGASLLAFHKLNMKLGYSHIANVDENAYFVRNDQLPLFKTELANINSLEELYRPRIPRCYRNRVSGEEIEFEKSEIESLTAADLNRRGLVPQIEKCLYKPASTDGLWTTPTYS